MSLYCLEEVLYFIHNTGFASYFIHQYVIVPFNAVAETDFWLIYHILILVCDFLFLRLGNRAMQSKLYSDAIELYNCAITLSENNAVYYCNRWATNLYIDLYCQLHE